MLSGSLRGLSSVFQRYRLSSPEKRLLVAMAAGATLKVHRTMDGRKEYRLHPLCAQDVAVDPTHVVRLCSCGFLDSNMKFPAATFILTTRGQQTAAGLAERQQAPLTARNYTRHDEYASTGPWAS